MMVWVLMKEVALIFPAYDDVSHFITDLSVECWSNFIIICFKSLNIVSV